MSKGFGSDNHSGVHPTLMQTLQQANSGHAPSYGTDDDSQKAIAAFRAQFGPQTEVFFVFNGTAANVLSLSFLCERYHSVLCSELSHMYVDECGAPEMFAAKLLPIPQVQGKISLETLKKHLIRKGDQHYSQTRALSLTQPTELGTCYSLQELKEITDWAHQNGLYVHIDGARLTNALIELNCSYKEMTSDVGIDVVSFGGTKNGLMMGEAVLVLNAELAKLSRERLKFQRKQMAQLPSKTRFIAAQFTTYLQDELNINIAKHSCEMAERLYRQIKDIPGIQVTAQRQSNAVFAILPKAWIKPAREKFFFYVWDEATFECRLMTGWDTSPEEVDAFADVLRKLAEG